MKSKADFKLRLFRLTLRQIGILTSIFLLFNSCKKNEVEQGPYDYLVGRWKPLSFIDFDGISYPPPVSPTPGVYYTVQNDFIIRQSVSWGKIQDSLYTISTIDTAELKFDITTQIKDDTILQIKEKYIGLRKNGEIAYELNYFKEINLNKGLYSTGISSCCAYRIETNKIYLHYYNFGFAGPFNQERTIVKMDKLKK